LPFLGPFVGKELPVISLAGVFIYFSWMGIEKKELGLAFSIFFVGWMAMALKLRGKNMLKTRIESHYFTHFFSKKNNKR